MHTILTAAQMRAADQRTSQSVGLPAIVLMERAALAVAEAVAGDLPMTEGKPAPVIAVAAGRGNNGADGVAAGRLLLLQGYRVHIFLIGGEPAEGSLCLTQLHILEQYGGQWQPMGPGELLALRPAAVIDAITGIGLHGPLAPDTPSGEAVQAINQSRETEGCRVYAVDLPSGIETDTGRADGCAVRADRTVTFGSWKRGQVLYPGTSFCGQISVADIGILFRRDLDCGRGSGKEREELLFGYDRETAADLLPKRNPAGNKGTFGKVLIIAGSRNMCGAALLSAEACARSGAGMVKVLTEECNRIIVQSAVPSLLLETYDPADFSDPTLWEQTEDRIHASLAWADTFVIGPGLGRGAVARRLTELTLYWLSEHSFRGLTVDADALRIIGENRALEELLTRAGQNGNVVLTPHLAECAALLHTTTAALKMERFPKIRQYAREHHCCLLCKDARSAAAAWNEEDIYLNLSGNDGLSTAGSGDVLAGMTGAFLAQGLDGFRAACAASWLHGRLAEKLTRRMGSRRTLIAEDLVRGLAQGVLNT